MPSLSPEEILDVRSDVMSFYSSIRQEVPMTKNQLTGLLTLMDDEMNTAEVAIVVAIPPGAARDWPVANDQVGRDLIVRTETKRRDTS